MSFWGHLSELLLRLRSILYSVAACTLIAMMLPLGLDLSSLSASSPWYTTLTSLVINRVRSDFLPSGVELIPVSWFAPLQVYIYVSLMLGAVMSLPVITYEFYKFIHPALYRHERSAIAYFILAFAAMFALGFILGYLLVIPATLRVLLLAAQPFGLAPRYDFAQFFSIVIAGLFICGFVMTFPLYLFIAVRAGILELDQVMANRRYLYGAILIGISLIDPDPSLVTELFLGIPLIAATEVALIVARRFVKPKGRS